MMRQYQGMHKITLWVNLHQITDLFMYDIANRNNVCIVEPFCYAVSCLVFWEFPPFYEAPPYAMHTGVGLKCTMLVQV